MSAALVKLLSVNVDDQNHVGQKGQWYYVAKVNDTSLSIGEEKSIILTNEEIRFYLEAYEKDKVTDKGVLSKNYLYKDIKNKVITLDVVVTENRGPYTGNKATVSFSFQIK